MEQSFAETDLNSNVFGCMHSVLVCYSSHIRNTSCDMAYVTVGIKALAHMWIMGEWSVNFYRFFCVDTISISKIIMQPVMCKYVVSFLTSFLAAEETILVPLRMISEIFGSLERINKHGVL